MHRLLARVLHRPDPAHQSALEEEGRSMSKRLHELLDESDSQTAEAPDIEKEHASSEESTSTAIGSVRRR
jgi:ABC-type Zn uptake system ZnuABC Zn-binding protein ZnuA